MKAPVAILIALVLPLLGLIAADKDAAKPLFEDKFDSALVPGWSWLREDTKAWRIGKEGLEIRALPGHGTQRKNILLGPARKAKEELSVEVFLDSQPTVQFEHAGIQCYFNERNWVGLVKEKVGKSEIVLTQIKDGKPKYAEAAYDGQTVWLRMVVSAGTATGFYRSTDKDVWKRMGACDLPAC